MGDSQVTVTRLWEDYCPPLAAHVPDVPPVPPPRPIRAQSIPCMNQQERMLPALGQWQRSSLAPPLGTMRQLWARVPGMPQPPPHSQPLLMLSQEQHGGPGKPGLHLLPITHPELKIPRRLAAGRARAQGMNGCVARKSVDLQDSGQRLRPGSSGRRNLPGGRGGGSL